jgi:arsenate reductase-like glutaredoxin family protein
VDKIITAKGKGFVTLDLKHDQPDEPTLLAALLGPSGNLRAPTFRKGKTLMVGFSQEAYESLLDD